MAGRKGKAKVEVEGEDMPNCANQQECFCMGAGPQVSAALRMGSEKTREHFRAARVEFLKGLRNLLDERIEALSQDDSTKKGAKIAVD